MFSDLAQGPDGSRTLADSAFSVGTWTAAGLIVALGLIPALRGRSLRNVDAPELDARITLLTSDQLDVGCSSMQTVDQYACEYRDAETRRQVSAGNTLRPYMTVDRRLYLIPHLFGDSAIARRSQQDPPSAPRETLRRFVAECKLRIVGRLPEVRTRWLSGTPWSEPLEAEVALATRCQVE